MKYHTYTEVLKRAYLQLYEQLRDDIVAGLYPYGKRLPSKRLLAEEAGVSVVTVEHAYALLCEEGYAAAKERRGYFCIFRCGEVFSAPVSRALPHGAAGEKREGDFPFSVYARAVRRVLADYGTDLFVKPSGFGCKELKNALSAYLARSRNLYADPEQILIGSGTEYFYGLLVQLLGKETAFAIEDPSYEKIERVYRANAVCPALLPLAADGIESNALKDCNACVLHLTPYRSFPSGVTASASKKREYLRWAEKEGRFLIEDDFESEFTLSKKPEDTLYSLGKNENVIYVNTFSKTVAPSIRVAYMVLPKRLNALFEERLGFYSCTVPLLDQLVLARLIENGDFERHINRVRRKFRREG